MAPDEKPKRATPPEAAAASVVMSLETSRDTDPRPRDASSLSWKCLFAFTRLRHAVPLLAALFSSVLVAGFRTVFAIILGKIFDVVAGFGEGIDDSREMTTQVYKWCLVLLGLGFGNWLANSALLATWIVFGELQAKVVRQEIFSRLLSRKLAYFDSIDHGVSSLLVRIQTQTREIQLATSQVLGSLLCNVMVSLASLGVAFWYSWKMTLILLATVPFTVLVLSLATSRLQPAIRAQKHHLQTASKLSTASVNAIDLVKVFNGFDAELRQYCRAIKLAGRQYLIQAQCNAGQMGFVGFWLIALFLVGFVYGVVLVEQGMDPGNVLTTFYATLAAFQGIEALLPQWLVLSKGMAAGQFLSSVAAESEADREPEPQSSSSLKPESCAGNVSMTKISFAYPSNPSRTVLNTSTFTFPAGEMSFIVGRSGSGKSTIGNLLAKFYDPSSGTISLDGQPLGAYDERWLRSHVTLIQQSSILFNDTFFNNVAVGHPDIENAMHDDIVSASEFALLQPTLDSLPAGLETIIGPNGYRLSGGQIQRLALARARLRDPTVLILDEVTSNLDPISRTLIMDAIREWRRDKTTIIITHDVNQILENDFVYVIEDAELVQQGLKKDLLRFQGPLATLDLLAENGPSSSSTLNAGSTAPSTPSTMASPTMAWACAVTNSLSASEEITLSTPSEKQFDAWATDDKDFDDSKVGNKNKDCETIELRPTSSRDRPSKGRRGSGSLRSTLATLWPAALSPSHRTLFLLGIVVCIVGAASMSVFAFCFAKLLAAMWSPGNKIQEGKMWAIYLAVVAVIDGVSTFFGHYLLEVVGQAWANSIRAEAMRRILRQPRSWFDREENSASRISQCLERNSEEMRNVVGRFLPIVISAVSVLVISMVWAVLVSWKLTLVALSPLPVVVAALKGYTIVSRKWESRCNKGAEETSSLLNEIFVNIRVVRALTLERHFGKKYRKSVSQTLGLGLQRAIYSCGLYGLYESIEYPTMALVFFYAASLLAKKANFTTIQVLQVVNLLLFSIGNATHLLSSLPQLTMAQATASQLLGYAELPLEHPPFSRTSSRENTNIQIDSPLPIQARDLAFSYPLNTKEQVLRGVSFDIHPGTCTAIVGPSGCGKSTIIALLMGLYAPSGPSQLRFAHLPHSHLDIQHLRSRMAYVSQTPFLFPATVAENIAYGLPHDSPFRDASQIQHAAHLAGLHDFIISLPMGYATPVGEGGMALSGGQAQRLSIARALVRRPQLLIMDEPSSALDAESSSTLRETIRSLVAQCGEGWSGMAIVLVTHSRDMMQVAGNIVMIEGGVKAQEGSYEELMSAAGPFRRLANGGHE